MRICDKGIYRDATPQEIADMTRIDPIAEIASLKEQLSATDYKAIKFAEGLISATDYEPIKAERQALRDRINELEAMLD